MSEPAGLSREEAADWAILETFTEAVMGRIGRELTATTGLTVAEFRVLAALAAAGGASRQRDLAETLGWDKARISHQLSRMHERGLLDRTKTESDGSQVRLRAAGRRALAEAQPVHAALVRRHVLQHIRPRKRALLEMLAAASAAP